MRIASEKCSIIPSGVSPIPDSYFGKTMGRKVEHGPLPLINMAVGIPDGETPEGIIEHFSEAIRIPENQKIHTSSSLSNVTLY
jgi:aminotransferase